MNCRIRNRLTDAGLVLAGHRPPGREFWRGIEREPLDGFARHIRLLELEWARRMAGLNRYPYRRAAGL